MALISDLVKVKFQEIQALHLGYDVSNAITATGNNSQANAYQLVTNINKVTTATSTTNSVKLPQAKLSPTGYITVTNSDSADAIYVFPYSGDSIDALAANLAIPLPPGGSVIFQKISDTSWVSFRSSAGVGAQTWTPTYSANGAMTWTVVTTLNAFWIDYGSCYYFELTANGTIGGVVNNELRFTLPKTKANTYGTFVGRHFNGAVTTEGYGGFVTTSQAAFSLYNSANYALGVGYIDVSGWCRV